ncbi:unnamed protein product [Somion occarium]|uniref:Dienelactone hydrolase domain-containing protein n=1 Tax=Somion occarium TaxID=3059160 RepID=A0ABP1CTS4_9APHY
MTSHLLHLCVRISVYCKHFGLSAQEIREQKVTKVRGIPTCMPEILRFPRRVPPSNLKYPRNFASLSRQHLVQIMACNDCVSGMVHKGTPKGNEITVASLPTYVTGDEKGSRIVIFGPDIFGWRFVNTRLLADEYASKGFLVFLPDLFDGRDLPQWTLSVRDPVLESPTLFQRIARPFALSVLVPFVLRNSHETQISKFTALVNLLRNDHPGAKFGMVGFCWGGRYAIVLNSLFYATVTAHPSLVKYPEELEGISKPISFALAEDDHNYDAMRGKDTERRLKEKGLTEFEVVVYKGVRHGWTLRGNMEDEQKRQARDQAFMQAV